MLSLDRATLFGLGVLAVLWLVGALWAIARGVAMQRAASFSGAQAKRLSAMIEAAPAQPLIVRPDFRIEGSDRLARWLGLEMMPSSFDQLRDAGRGLSEQHFLALRAAVRAAQRTARPFSMLIGLESSHIRFLVEGVPADPASGAAGSAVLWFQNVSELANQLTSARSERDEAVAAFDALSALIEAAPMPMWYRREGQLTLVNRAYVEATGAQDADDVIMRQVELVEPVAGETAQDAARRALQSESPVQRTIPVTARAVRRLTRVVDVPVGSTGVAGYAIDLHDLEKVRSELRALSQSQRDMLDRLSTGVARFSKDRQLLFCNQPFRRLFALAPDSLAEQPPFDRVLDQMRENGRLPETRDFPAWRAERNAWFSATDLIEEAWMLRDGSHVRAMAQPAPDGGLLLLFEDRTEQVRLAGARDILLRVRAATLDNLFEAIAVFSSDGRLQSWNRRFSTIWGLDEGFLSTHPRIDTLLNRVAPLLKKSQHASIIQELVRSATVERRQRQGQADFANGAIYRFAATPLPDGNALFAMLDISDSHRMERALTERAEALAEADRIKSDFLAKMSYELRTPITTIAGFAELIDGGYAGDVPPQAREYVGAILQSVQELGRHIDTVLDLAQSEAGNLPLDITRIDLAAMLQQAFDAALPKAQDNQLELVLEIDPSLGQGDGDPRRIRQIVDQLLGNAINFTAAARIPEGRVQLYGDGTDKRVRIIVSDNGPGLDEAAQKAAFDLKARTPPSHGAAPGFGLALARQLAEAHGGTLTLVSRVGEGALVALEWPRQAP